MLIPISTDAPIYYWPYATVGVIVANIVAFVMVWPLLLEDNETAIHFWLLVHGEGIYPWQWLTSMFMHGSPLHLIGNMVFLWVFGLIVEGKLGWWKFLLVYLGVGVTQSAMEQVLMLGLPEVGYSLGASSAIYGLMAIAIVWAPRNEINCFYWLGWMFAGTTDISIITFACIYLAFDTLEVILHIVASGSVLSTGWLHITGALIGVPVGIFMVKRKLVDCEGWDIFHAWNQELEFEKDYTKVDAEVQKKKQAKDANQLQSAKQQFDFYLQEGNIRAAVALYGKMLTVGEGLQLSREELLAIVRGLHERKEWAASAAFMFELISRFPELADPLRIKLAQICVVELDKPARAVELLGQVDFAKQPDEKKQLAKKIQHRARQMQADGVYEVDDGAF
jgi:membrane associated rhomboid family serine protease